MKVRVSMHNARVRADGSVFDVRHNDRSRVAGSVVSDSSRNCYYVFNYVDGADGLSVASERVSGGLREHELNQYRSLFSASLDAQNARHMARGHMARVKSIEDVYSNARTCPEETYLAIGKSGEDVSYKDLMMCVNDYIRACHIAYPQMRCLDVSCHRDEAGQLHAHLRRVYVAHGDDGDYASESAALRQMGVPLMFPDKPSSRYNNSKVRLTANTRDLWVAVCREHGFDVIDIPAHPGKLSANKEQYVCDKLRAESAALADKIVAARNALDSLDSHLRYEYGVGLSETVQDDLSNLDAVFKDLDASLS